MDASSVVPLLVEMGDPPPHVLYPVLEKAVAVGMGAIEDFFGGWAQVGRPMLAHFAEVTAAHTAGGDNDMLSSGGVGRVFGHGFSGDSGHDAIGYYDIGDFMVKFNLELVAAGVFFEGFEEATDNFLADTPGDVPAGYGIAGGVVAALGPVYDGEKFDAFAVEEVEDVFEGVFAIEACPGAGQLVFFCKFCIGEPVAVGEVGIVRGTVSFLIGGADHVDAAEGVFGETTEFLWGVFVEEEDALALVEELVGGDDAGETAAGYDDFAGVGLFCHGVFPVASCGAMVVQGGAGVPVGWKRLREPLAPHVKTSQAF